MCEMDPRPTASAELEVPPAEAIRERDALWCRAVVATLDLHQAEQVLAWFNAHRPDGQPPARAGGGDAPAAEFVYPHNANTCAACAATERDTSLAADEIDRLAGRRAGEGTGA